MDQQQLPEGVYESLRTGRLDEALAQLVDLRPRFEPVDPVDAPHVLARHVAAAVERALATERDGKRRVAVVNDLLARLAAQDEGIPGDVEQCSAATYAGTTARDSFDRPVVR